MTELSPAAQAVLGAYSGSPLIKDHLIHRLCLAAALRAAVAHTQQHHNHDVWKCDADDLIAIAEELENT